VSIRVVIVDDEIEARAGIRKILEADPDVTIEAECAGGRQAVQAIRRLKPDLVFLDVQMPDMDGFQVLEQIDATKSPDVVFVTAYDRYAVKAFDVHAIDYLLKPFSDERFFQALSRAKSRLKKDTAYVTRFFVKGSGEISFVPVEDVDWIEALTYYVKLHVGKKSHLIRANIGRLETQLDPTRFTRIHRSTVVNVTRIRAVKDSHVVLKDGTELVTSRSGRRRLSMSAAEHN